MIKNLENIEKITLNIVFSKFGHIKWDQKILCACDNCKKDFSREWYKIKKNLNETLCINCLYSRGQSKRYANKEERKIHSERMKKYFKDPKNIEKNANALKKHHKEHPETSTKQSLIAKKRFENPIEREKISEGNKKRFEDPIEREKLSVSQKLRYKNDPQAKVKISEASKKAWRNGTLREKQKKSLEKYFSNPEIKLKLSIERKKIWQDEKFRARMLPIIIKNRLSKSFNKMERFLYNIINVYGFYFVGNGTVRIAGFCPDFINENKKLIIEFNGCYWHKCRQCYPDKFKDTKFLKRDLAKLHAYPREGYKVLFIWEHDLKDLNSLKHKIENFINSNNYNCKIRDAA